jgi:hypothetical protein
LSGIDFSVFLLLVGSHEKLDQLLQGHLTGFAERPLLSVQHLLAD